MKSYDLLASPTLFPGQVLSMRVEADKGNSAPVSVRAFVKLYGAADEQQTLASPVQVVAPGHPTLIRWTVPDTGGCPVFAAGCELAAGTERSGRSGGGRHSPGSSTWISSRGPAPRR